MMLAGGFHCNFPHDCSLLSTPVVPPLLVSFSATPTDTSSDRKPLSPQKAFTRAPLSMQGRRPNLLLAISSPYRHVLKVPLSATSRINLVTVVHSRVPPEIMPPSLVTPLMRTRPASASHLAQRRLSLAARVPLSVSLLVGDVSTNHCSRQVGHITNTRPSAIGTGSQSQ